MPMARPAGCPKRAGFGGEDNVAGTDHLAAAGQAPAVDLGDDRLAVAPHPEPAVDRDAQVLAVEGDAGLAELPGLVAGALVGSPIHGAAAGG